MLFSWRKLLLVLEQRLNEETNLQADVSWSCGWLPLWSAYTVTQGSILCRIYTCQVSINQRLELKMKCLIQGDLCGGVIDHGLVDIKHWTITHRV